VEMSGGAYGAEIVLPDKSSLVRVLFGEWLGRFLLATTEACAPAVERACEGLPLTRLGIAGGAELVFRYGTKTVLRGGAAALHSRRESGLAWLTRA